MEVAQRYRLMTLLTWRTLSTWFTLLTCWQGAEEAGLGWGADGTEGAKEAEGDDGADVDVMVRTPWE